MDLQKLAASLHPLERKVFPVLDKHQTLTSISIATGLKEVEITRALQWLENKKLISTKTTTEEVVLLGKNGQRYKKEKLPERRFLNVLKEKELPINELAQKASLDKSELNASLGILRKKALVHISKDKTLKVKLTEQGKNWLEKEFLEEKFLKKDFPLKTKELAPEEKAALKNLKERKEIITVETEKHKTVTLTPLGKQLLNEGLVVEKNIVDAITPKILATRGWKGKKFRRYDVLINVPKIWGGRKHLVTETTNYIRKLWLEMGFQEMTGSLVQTAFWDLDALFVPQDHPAREMQDTFYLKKPSRGKLPKEIAKKVKAVHEHGGKTQSTGWKMPWNEKKAQELLLRTHCTVLSAQAISRLKESDLPAKYFAVGKVFRNETLDWKHLFEFHQVEGIVVDPQASLKHLAGYIREFYKKMGHPEVKLVPSHFPYTEPSMEVRAWHPVKKEWVELGGAGIFRPEVVVPLLGKDVPVLAWGLGLERVLTSYYNITDLRNIYKNDLKQLREARAWTK